MKSFRVTKTKEQIAEQKVKEENSLVELQEFFSMLASANKTTDVYVDETAIEAIEELVESNDFQDMLSTEDCVIAAFEEPEPEKTLVDIAAESIKKTTQVKESVFELPTGARVEADVKHLQSRLQDLQNWLSKIAMTGPGSGEVNFRWLDDVNRSSINDGWVLEYDSASKKFQFTENIGDIRTIKFNTDGPTTELVPGQIAWNPHEDCLDVRHADGATLQTGLEQHYRVYNNGATTLTQGTLVGFGGIHMVDGDELPVAIPYVANATALPYIVSLMADQYFELMWAVDSTNVSLLSPAATSFAPSTPCAVVAISQTSL